MLDRLEAPVNCSAVDRYWSGFAANESPKTTTFAAAGCATAGAGERVSAAAVKTATALRKREVTRAHPTCGPDTDLMSS